MSEIAVQLALGFAQEVLSTTLVEVGSLAKRQINLVRSFDMNMELLRGTMLPTVKELMVNRQALAVMEAKFSEAEREKFLRGLSQFSSNAEVILREFNTYVAQRQIQRKKISRRQKWKVARKIKALFAEFEEISHLLQKAQE